MGGTYPLRGAALRTFRGGMRAHQCEEGVIMRIRHDDMVRLMGEFSRAIPPFLSHDLAGKWNEWLCRVASLMLRCKPDDIFWAIQAFEADAELWADGDDAAHQPSYLSDADWAEACEMFGHEPDDNRYDYWTNIDWIPMNTDIDVELAEDRSHILGGDDIDFANESAREREDEELREDALPPYKYVPRVEEIDPDDPVPQDERTETLISQPAPTVSVLTTTEGVICTIPDLKDLPFSRIEGRCAKWVTGAARRSFKRGGELRIMSVFPDGAANMSWDGYEKLIAHQFPLSAGFEQALWLEEHQLDFPWLMSLLGRVVIDWWGTDPQGREKSRGIVRMRKAGNAWKVGIEWFFKPFGDRDERLSDMVRIAVFEGKS